MCVGCGWVCFVGVDSSVSAEATFWAWRQSVKSSMKLTLLALANCHNENTGQCNPSIAYISKSTGLNRKTVMSALFSLEEMGLIKPQKAVGAGSHYVLITSAKIGTTSDNKTSTKNGTSPKINQSQKRDCTSTKNGHDQSQKRDTNLKETKNNLKKYSFSGETIKLTHEDFEKCISTYRNLDVYAELLQLDLELGGEKGWFMTMHAKLNYRNKNNGKHQTVNEKAAQRRRQTRDPARATDF